MAGARDCRAAPVTSSSPVLPPDHQLVREDATVFHELPTANPKRARDAFKRALHEESGAFKAGITVFCKSTSCRTASARRADRSQRPVGDDDKAPLRRDFTEPVLGPRRNHLVALAAGRNVAPEISPTARQFAWIARFDLVERKPIPVAPGYFLEPVVGGIGVGIAPERLTNDRRCLTDPALWNRHHREAVAVTDERRQRSANAPGL